MNPAAGLDGADTMSFDAVTTPGHHDGARTAGPLRGPSSRQRRLVRVSSIASIWALWYAAYRGYYAAGGTAFLPGTIRQGSESEFRGINLAGAAVIGAAAVLPPAALRLWSRRRPRRLFLGVCWIVAVGCSMHALVDITQGVLSLAGVVRVHYPPLWATVDHRVAALQDVFFNEPWFLVEGLCFGALGWVALGPGHGRRWWIASAGVGIAALTALGILTVAGLSGRLIIL